MADLLDGKIGDVGLETRSLQSNVKWTAMVNTYRTFSVGPAFPEHEAAHFSDVFQSLKRSPF